MLKLGTINKGQCLKFENYSYLCTHESDILSLPRVFDFIKKGGEIRLWETLATIGRLADKGANT